jgi:adenylate kinase family enzyme
MRFEYQKKAFGLGALSLDHGGISLRAFRHEKRLRPRAHRNMLIQVERVVIVGRGGAGKSTAALRLSELTGLPVIELDKRFWRPDLTPTPRDEWIQMQRELIASPQWIMDGDFGPHDVLAVRLARADAVLILDFSFVRCAWRAARRSRERADFWRWLLMWRLRSRPALFKTVAGHALGADVRVLRNPAQLRRYLATIDEQMT